MNRKLLFTPGADVELTALEGNSSLAGVFKQVKKTLKFLEINPRHPGLHTHEYESLEGPSKERVW